MNKKAVQKEILTKIGPIMVGSIMAVIMGVWLFTHPTTPATPILGIAFIAVFGFLLFLVAEIVRDNLNRKDDSNNETTK